VYLCYATPGKPRVRPEEAEGEVYCKPKSW
jgi:hypothetical protein